MSVLGKDIISALEEATRKGLVEVRPSKEPIVPINIDTKETYIARNGIKTVSIELNDLNFQPYPFKIFFSDGTIKSVYPNGKVWLYYDDPYDIILQSVPEDAKKGEE